LDASVLYPAPVRDLLMHFAVSRLFRARWTRTIHDEWIRALLTNRPDLSRERLERTRELMDAAIPDCLVEGYDELIPNIFLPDPDDRHVLAAAIRANATVIVTTNTRDFPEAALAEFKVDAQIPDMFALSLFHMTPEAVCACAKQHRERLKRPAKTVDEYLRTLERHGLLNFVSALGNSSHML
jgi:hypothetical protein